MTKKCEHTQPTFRVTMHLPATSWHTHADKTFQVKQPTEFEAWAHLVRSLLMTVTQGNVPFMLGYLGDLLNTLDSDMRTALLTIITKGFGLEIKEAEDTPHTIEVGLVPRYPPLVEKEESTSGLVVPESRETGLVLPGEVGYDTHRR